MSNRRTKHVAVNANDRLTLECRNHRYLDKFKDGILVESDDGDPRTVIALTWTDLEQRLHSRRLVVHQGYYATKAKAPVGKTFSKEQIAYFEAFARLVLDACQPNTRAAYMAMEADRHVRAKDGFPIVDLCSLSTFCRIVNSMRTAKSDEVPTFSSTLHPTEKLEVRPMDFLEMDDHKIDVRRVGMNLGIWDRLHPEIQARLAQIRAAWATAAMDACTRSLCALHLTVGTPDVESVTSTLAMAVRAKYATELMHHGCANWVQYGRPARVHVDRAAPYCSETFVGAVVALTGKHPIPCSQHPHLRGRVERMFRSLVSGQVGPLPRGVGDSILLRETYDPTKHGHLTDDELLALFAMLVAERYNNIPHRALDGQTPSERWVELSHQGDGIAPAPSKAEYRDLFGVKLHRRVTARGISILGIEYRSAQLEGLHQFQHRAEVDVSVDESDISVISFRDPRDGCWYDAYAEFAGLDNVALSEWMETIRYITSCLDQPANSNRKIVISTLNDLKGRTVNL
ncbi:Mu transposase C-terminal domain-containing protein [Rhizobium sp. Rhizsp42]|uniref:Mu transposase C-terminal domain-containing protein n=1 Tax=Rhizobium sp. Rhizsp42 TaxID=3243034 RepID=UPI0039B102C6